MFTSAIETITIYECAASRADVVEVSTECIYHITRAIIWNEELSANRSRNDLSAQARELRDSRKGDNQETTLASYHYVHLRIWYSKDSII